MGRKLTLNVETLSVSSFDTGESPEIRGTVEAREAANCPYTYCASCTVMNCDTFWTC